MTYRVLCVDGGGARGVLPATFLSYLEKTYGKPCHELFDFFCGTSTGSILCGGLVHPRGFSAHDIVNLYMDNLQKIFTDECFQSIRNLFEPKYPATGLQAVLADNFGDAKLGAALKPFCATSFDLVSNLPVWLTSYGTPEVFIRDALCSSASGPTYFRAHGNLVDGGLVANNPSLVGLAEAISRGSPIGAVRILSLGTGRYDPSLANLADGGELAWASSVSQVTIDGVAERDAYLARALLESRYLRIQPQLSKVQAPMDNIDVTNMAELQALAAQAYSDNQKALEEFFK